MTWKTLQAKVQELGFDLAFHSRRNDAGGYIPDLSPPNGVGWVYVGNFDNIAGLWIKPLSESSRKLSSSMVRTIIAELDPFIGTVGDYNADLSVTGDIIVNASGRRRLPALGRRSFPNFERRGAPRIDRPDQTASL